MLVFVIASVCLFAPPQGPAALRSGPEQRCVDCSDDLLVPDVVAVVATLGKLKEGRRERLPDGSLGSATQHVSVSGTQYFKVPVTAPLEPRTQLVGKTGDKPAIGFDLQLARRPDGKERRQSLTGNGAAIEPGMLALWVLAPQPKGKGYRVLHVIPFDPMVDKGADPEQTFIDTMRDFMLVNQRVRDLKRAIADLEHAADEKARQQARDALSAVLDTRTGLVRPELQSLVATRVWPYEKRARELLGRDAGPGK
jgi:hypothetical protein